MLTADLLEELNAISAADIALGGEAYAYPTLPIPASHYDMLLDWMMEVHRFKLSYREHSVTTFRCLAYVIQHTEELRCNRTTRYLAKLYTDTSLTLVDDIPSEKLQLLGIASIRLAVKFNESYDYPASLAITNTGQQYSHEQILEAERQLFALLRFKLKFTTPYCYLRIIKELVPVVDEALFNRLELLVSYCSMASQFFGLASGQLLFAALLFLVKSSSQAHYQNIVLAVGSRWPHIEQIADQIGQLLQSDLQAF